MNDLSTILDAARDAYRRRDWPAAREGFKGARRIGPLDVDDLYQLSDAEWWLGHIDAAVELGEVAFREYLRAERPREAAIAAMGIAISHFLRGDETIGSGWMSRATRLLADVPEETPEHGYAIYILQVESQFGAGDPAEVIEAAQRVQEIGRRHRDPNLVAAGMLGEGRTLVRHGDVAQGMALLDEAMVAVLADELSPDWAGNIYCNIMVACHELADHRRAAQWTDATERWLETMPVAVLFRGVCRVHRSQVHQLRGAWERAEQDALRVCDELAGISIANVAEGWYQVAEIRRLRGDLPGAEEAYREAHQNGRDPQPGLALLRLAQGRVATAAASIESALAARPADRLARAPLLVAQVEVTLAGKEQAVARQAADELALIAGAFGSSGLEAASCQAVGSVLLAEGDAAAALPVLRDALARWRALEAPFEAAIVRRRLARAYDALGDHDAAQLEREVATTSLTQLGAPTRESSTRQRSDGLSPRELEVLGLVATGRTNRQVADQLIISEKTVARHLSNIFAKLELSSRTEAAAYAFEHGLTSRGRG